VFHLFTFFLYSVPSTVDCFQGTVFGSGLLFSDCFRGVSASSPKRKFTVTSASSVMMICGVNPENSMQ
jgi:hypothetical protein